MSNGDVDIGGWSNIGPGGKYQGRLVGLLPLSHAISDIGAPLLAGALARRKAAKDFNDAPAERIVGSANNGQVVHERVAPGVGRK